MKNNKEGLGDSQTTPENRRLEELQARGENLTEKEKEELTGLIVFKENSRGSELWEKKISGTITKREEAELKGLFAFPDNPRGAELVEKDIIGTITEEEKVELKKLTVDIISKCEGLTEEERKKFIAWYEKGIGNNAEKE